MEKTVASKGNQEYTYESFPAYLIPEYCILIVIVVGGVSRLLLASHSIFGI